MFGISCHDNTKFLHAIAGVCLYLMHRKWNSYVYLQPDTTTGNFEVTITFIVTTHPLQFIHCTDKRFLWHCLWNSIVTFPVIQFWVIHLKTLPYTKSSVTFSAVHCSSLLQFFQSGACFSLHTHTRYMHRHFLSSLACVTGILHINCSLPTNLLAGLLVWHWAWVFHTPLASNPLAIF
jgi:hypothetical protein